MLFLVEANEKYTGELAQFKKEVLLYDKNRKAQFAGCMGLRDCSTEKDWTNLCNLRKRTETCEQAGTTVPSTTYFAIRESDNRLVGVIDLRHHIDHPILGTWGGHCGYSVRPSERGKGYANEMLRLNIQNAKRMGLPINDRLAVFSDILSFLECVVSRNYVAIDFYDGSIMYDFVNGKTTICDIDLFRKQPCVNDMGHMWGSSRFQSPEEHQLGADIDEITNVYTLGATAFALFGEYNRTREKWQLSDKLFEIATRAVSDDRANRQQTIRQFTAEWEAAQ